MTSGTRNISKAWPTSKKFNRISRTNVVTSGTRTLSKAWSASRNFQSHFSRQYREQRHLHYLQSLVDFKKIQIHLFAGRAVKRERRKGSSCRHQTAYGSAINEVAGELLRSARSPKGEKWRPKVRQARRDDRISSRFLSLLLTAAIVSCGCHTRAPKPNLCVLCV